MFGANSTTTYRASSIRRRRSPSAARAGCSARRRDGRDQGPAFADLPALLRAGDLLVSTTHACSPRALAGRRPSGGRVEVLLERVLSRATRARACARATCRSPAPSSSCRAGRARAWTRARADSRARARPRRRGRSWSARRDAVAAVIERTPDAADRERYQTVFARTPGRGRGADRRPPLRRGAARGARRARRRARRLHAARRRGYVRARARRRVEDHELHAEWLSVPAEPARRSSAAARGGGRVVAVGTTSCARSRPRRVAAGSRRSRAKPKLFIYPGFRFRVVDALVTNFHLPESSLLMLVAAFAGRERDARGVPPRGRAALSLLQLRRRDARDARRRGSKAFDLLGRTARRGADAYLRARHDRHARVHARRHVRRA